MIEKQAIKPATMLRMAARDRDLGFHVTASWADVQRKAKRIRAEGGVTIVIASNDGIGGRVQGDHGVYEALLVYRPGTKKVADWTCGCKWAAYAFDRSPAFSRFEGRKCSHALALQFEAQSQGMFGKEVHPSEPTSRERAIVRYDPDSGEHIFVRPYEGSLVGTLVARLRAEDADPAEVIGNLMRAGVRHRTAVLLWKGAYAEENVGTLIPVRKAGYKGYVDAYPGHHDEMNEQDRAFDPEEAERNNHPDVRPVGSHTPVTNLALRAHDNDFWNKHGQVEEIDHSRHDTYATQPYVTQRHVNRYIEKPDDTTQSAKTHPDFDLPSNRHPMMVRHEGSLYAIEGHHRIAANMATGRSTHALVYDMDKQGMPEPARMDYDVEHPGLRKYARKKADCDFEITDEKRAAEHALRHHDDGICTLTERKRGKKRKKLSMHEEGGERRCPHCSGFIGVEAFEHHHCPHCGAPLGGEGHHEGAKQRPPGPHVSGVALKAHDTGRVLMLQRGLDDPDDPAAGTWEFPGGHHEEGDQSSLHAGIREWEEEVGQEFPLHGVVKHVWTSPNGVYQGHVVVIPSEKDLSMKDGRVIPNPDDPKGDGHEQAAWWDPEHARKLPALRDEVKAHTPWKEIAKASLDTEKTAAAWDPISNVNPQPGRGTSAPAHSNTTNPASTGWAASEDPDNWDNLDANPEPLTPSLGFDAALHDEPEPALPTTYGDEDATMRPAEMTQDDLDPIPDNPPAQMVPDQDANIHLLDGGSSLPNSYHASAAPESQEVADVIAAFHRTAAGQELMTAATSKPDDDIAAAAKAHLAKEAAAKFDFAEQQELINEGNDGRKARNLGDLKIEGTHYELLEAALAHQDADPSDIFS